MAVQIDTEELKGCKSYFAWIMEKLQPGTERLGMKVSEGLCRLMFSTDFTWTDIEEDGIRAKDATDIRRVYAQNVGEECGKNEREIDRIWKSVHGKCSVLELIFSMCIKLDEMVNEGEEGEMVPDFFRILCWNVGFLDTEVMHYDGKIVVPDNWRDCLLRLMERKYDASGHGGGLFPLEKWSEKDGKDQRKVSIWYQMNTWLNENLDEDEHFLLEKFDISGEKLGKI